MRDGRTDPAGPPGTDGRTKIALKNLTVLYFYFYFLWFFLIFPKLRSSRAYFYTFLKKFDQIFGQVFGPEYSVQYYRDGEIQCTVLLGRKILLRRLISKQKFKLFP